MRIVVLVKHVPDAASDIKFSEDLTTDRGSVDGLLSQLDEYAIEQALQLVERHSGEITYLTMGPAAAADALRKALSMGGDAGIHILDDALHGSDVMATSLAIAAALNRCEWDLVLTGMASPDSGTSVIPSLIAERLALPALTMAGSLEVESGLVTIRRDDDTASMVLTAQLPAVVSVTDQTGEARYPSFKGIMAAKKKPITTWSLADIGVDSGDVGLAKAWSVVEAATPRPPRVTGTVIQDEGDGGLKIAEFLATNKFI